MRTEERLSALETALEEVVTLFSVLNQRLDNIEGGLEEVRETIVGTSEERPGQPPVGVFPVISTLEWLRGEVTELRFAVGQS